MRGAAPYCRSACAVSACSTVIVQDRDDPPPPYFGDYPNGAYWSAVPPGDEGEGDDDYTVAGTGLRLMWDEGGGPLWSIDGCLPPDPVWLHRSLGISAPLAADLLVWQEDMNAFHYGPPTQDWRTRHHMLDERADELVERLRSEIGTRYEIRYRGRTFGS